MTPKITKRKEIPLVKALANPERAQATPLDVFKLARKFWLEGRRISIGDLAKGVGVSRVTLYRWVESKDRLVPSRNRRAAASIMSSRCIAAS